MSLSRPITCRSKSPQVRRLFARFNQSALTSKELAQAIPVDLHTIYAWAAGRAYPNILNLEAAFNVLDYTLIDRPMEPKDGKELP